MPRAAWLLASAHMLVAMLSSARRVGLRAALQSWRWSSRMTAVGQKS